MLELLSGEEKYYIIGLFQGDANHSESTRNRGNIQWEVSIKDSELVYKVEKILSRLVYVSIKQRTRNISFKTGHTYKYTSLTLTVCNQSFRNEIKPYVPVGRKCDILVPPFDLSKDMVNHYLRGLYDADGSLGMTGNNFPYMSICVKSEAIKDFICNYMKETLGIRKNINRNKRDKIYNIMLNKEFAQVFSNLLYKDASIFLDRKYKKYLEIQDWKRPSYMRKKVTNRTIL